ncbi:hypothetical protein BX666DRAFT_1942401, partial [Dichotomocladium elegans]
MVRLKFLRSNTEEDNYLHSHEPLSAIDPSHAKLAFAHANTEPRRWKTPQHHFPLLTHKNATTTSGHTRAHRHLLSNVIQLFEESIDENRSYKMKANGAIVMNRDYHRSKNQRDNIDLYVSPPDEGDPFDDHSINVGATSSGLLSWDSDVAASSDDDDEDDVATDYGSFPPTTTALSPPPRPSHINKSDAYLDACEVITSSYSRELVDLVFHENQRLRDQLAQSRREDRAQLLKSNDALASAKREARYLRRILSCTRILNGEATGGRRRRQSTGGVTAAMKRELGMHPLSSFCHTSSMSHEHKLKILLDEIEAMQLEDNQLQAKLDQLEKRNAILKRTLWEKDEIIRQLKFDMQMEALN